MLCITWPNSWKNVRTSENLSSEGLSEVGLVKFVIIALAARTLFEVTLVHLIHKRKYLPFAFVVSVGYNDRETSCVRVFALAREQVQVKVTQEVIGLLLVKHGISLHICVPGTCTFIVFEFEATKKHRYGHKNTIVSK